MSAFEIVIICAIVMFGVFVYTKIYTVFLVIEGICEFIVQPIDRLSDALIKPESTSSVVSIIRRVIMILIFLVSVSILLWYLFAGNIKEFMQYILDGTAFGGFITLADEGFSPSGSINYAAMLGAGLSSFISLLYMRYTIETLEDMDLPSPIYWILIVLFNVAFLCISCILSGYMTAWCSFGAEFLLDVYQQLVHGFTSASVSDLLGLLKVLGIGLVLLVLLYAALATLTIVLREYLATICYGAFNIAVIIICALIFHTWLNLPDFLVAIPVLASIISTEYIRANEAVKDSFDGFILDLFS